MPRAYDPELQFFDDNGVPLDGGKLYTYEVGLLTPAPTYSDNGEAIANANPIILDASGRAGNVFFSGQQRWILHDANDVQQWDRDYVGDSGAEGQFSDWSSATTYGAGDYVTYSGVNYVSIAAANLNNIPSSSPTKWSQVNIVRSWNANETYGNQAIVLRNGGFFASQITTNTGNDPATDRDNWRAMQPDAEIVITGPNTFFGYGVSSVVSTGNEQAITFNNGATTPTRQLVTPSWPAPNATDFFEGGVEYDSTTAVTLHQYLGSVATPSASASYPIGVTRWLV